jgi:DHA2 family multidrug resistance protein-like MFS transporter
MGLAVLALPTLLVSVDIGALYLALPHLSAHLGASSTQQLWIMDVYGFMVAGFLITMGTLGDRIGRRRLLLIGGAAFAVASVFAAYSTSPALLIGARALLGVAGATLMPSTLALISNLFQDTRQRSAAIGVWASCLMVGAVVGPVVGGLLLEHFWWGSVFLLSVPIMALLLLAAPSLLPEYRDRDAGRLDLVSVALSLAALLPIIYGMKEVAAHGAATSLAPFAGIAGGVAAGWTFVRRQRRLASPLLDLRLFGDWSFSAALTLMLLGGATLGGLSLLASQYLQSVAGLSPARAGLWLAPAAVAMAAGSLLAPAIARRLHRSTVIAAGLVLAAAGLLLLTQVGSSGGLPVLVAGIGIVHFGAAPLFALGTDLIVGSAPPNRAGSAASTSETSNELGVALGLATFGSIGTAVYRHQMAGAAPSGVPADAAQTSTDSLAGATTVAEQLSAGRAAELLGSAHAAFSSGLNTAAGVAAVLFIALAITAATLLRHVRSGGPDGPAPAGDESAATPAAT